MSPPSVSKLDAALERWEERRAKWERCFTDAGREPPPFTEPAPIACPDRICAETIDFGCEVCGKAGFILQDDQPDACERCEGHGHLLTKASRSRRECDECGGHGHLGAAA